jgi:pimeloyl-ACP methyl ester carboxylesterase
MPEVMPLPTVLLASNAKCEALFHKGSSDYLIITFNDMTMLRNGINFWGEALAKSADLSCMSVMTAASNWFPVEAVAELIPAMRPVVEEFRTRKPEGKVVLFGHSMGGYAAARFGALLEADVSIAFCPQYSIDPLITADHDTRYRDFFHGEEHRDHTITADHLSRRTLVIYDPEHDQDRWNVEHIAALSDSVTLIPVFHTGHETIRVAASSTFMTALFKHAINDDVLEMAKLLREAKKQNDLFLARLGEMALHKGHVATANAIADRLRDIRRPLHPDATLIASELCKFTGRFETAATFLDMAIEMQKSKFLLVKKAELYAMAGNRMQASFLLDALRDEFKDHYDFRRVEHILATQV